MIVIDKENVAMNLLVPCYCGTEAVSPLSTLVAWDREWLRDTSIVVAGSAMEILITRCYRIMKLVGHQAIAVSPKTYRQELSRFYKQVSENLAFGKWNAPDQEFLVYNRKKNRHWQEK